MLIGSRQRLAKIPLEPNICIGSDPIKRVRDTKILGVYIDEPLTWSKHIEEIAKTITAEIRALKRLKDFASRDDLVSVYNALIAWKISASEGYRLSEPIGTTVTDLLYIDHLKIFAASESKLCSVMNSVMAAMEDVGLI